MQLQVVFRKGRAFCSGDAESARAVPGILQAWVSELQAFQVLQAMHCELQAALQQRADLVSSDESVRLCPQL